MLTGIPVLALLFLPVLAQLNTLFSWLPTSADHGAEAVSAPAPHASGDSLFSVSTAHAQVHDSRPEARPPLADTEGSSPEEAQEHHVMQTKKPYLNVPFFLARAVFYFMVWILLALAYFRWSTRQDATKDTLLTVKMQKLAPWARSCSL